MKRRPRILLALLWVLVAVAVATPPAAFVFADHAHAQLFKRKKSEDGAEQPRERRGLFQRLFGGGRRDEAQPEAEPRRSTSRRRGGDNGLPGVGVAGGAAGAAGGAVVAAPKQLPAVEKLENARVVLVVGDFLAGGLGEGLEEAFAQSPGVRVVTRQDGSSGFVRDDHYDWPGSVGEIVDQEKPAAVIVMLGANDRQQMNVGGERLKPRSEEWDAQYRTRLKAMAETVRSRGVPLMWMGLPSFKADAMTADMIAFNDLYRAAVEQVGGEFIDIWDGFVDENGAFMPVGPDMNGQRVRLRGSDGINMTKAGKRKLAFYAERPLNRLLGSAVTPGVAPMVLEGGAPAVLTLRPAEIDRTAPMALIDPMLDGGTQLLGARVEPAAEPIGIPVEKLVREGVLPVSQPGRADNFMKPATVPSGSTAPAVAAGETTATIRN